MVIPTDGHYASYYSQAISATAPDPAAARLWEEYLYSTTGQNLWLQGSARPIELASLVKNGTADKKASAALPQRPGAPSPSRRVAQPTAAETWCRRTGPRPSAGDASARITGSATRSRHDAAAAAAGASALVAAAGLVPFGIYIDPLLGRARAGRGDRGLPEPIGSVDVGQHRHRHARDLRPRLR